MAWLRLFSHGIHRIHRSFVALIRPRNSQNSQKLGCVSPPTDFTDLHRWLGCVGPPTDFTDLHRWLGCVCSSTEFTEVLGCCWQRGYGRMPYPPNLCASVRIRAHLWETLLCKKLLCVPWVLWEYSLPRITQICTDGLVASVLPRNSQKFWGAVGSVGTAGCHTLLICAHPCASVRICGRLFSARNFCAFRGCCGNTVSHGFHRLTQMVGCVNSPTEFTEVWGCCWLRGYGRMPYPPNLCASVPICGRNFSARMFRVFCAFCGRCFSVIRVCVLWEVLLNQKSESSVGDYSFSMRKRLTMPKTRA